MSEYLLSLTANKEYVLKGDVPRILSNRRAKMALNNLNVKIVENGFTFCTSSEESIQMVVDKIRLILKYSGDTLIYSGNVDSEIDQFDNAEKQFFNFSKEAANIKQNKFNHSELLDFADSLAQNMPRRTLYKLQLLSAYHLAFSQNACNFSVPGAGKTSIVYGAFAYLNHLPEGDCKKIDKILIFSPLSAFGPWEEEYLECFGVNNELVSKRICGNTTSEEKKLYFYGKTAVITLVNYDSVPVLKDEIAFFLKNNHVMLVLDEAHKIKNTQGGVRASAVMSLAQFAKSRVVLTGTPVPNGYEDLFNLFHFIWPDRDIIKYSVAQLRAMTEGNNNLAIPHLIDNINPFFIRIRKSDLGLPPAKEHSPIIVPMGKRQECLYRFIEDQFVKDVSEKTRSLHSELTKARLIRLMQAATNPMLLMKPLSEFASEGDDFSSIEAEDSMIMSGLVGGSYDEVPPKFQTCKDLIEQILSRNERVIVWATFIGNILFLQNYLKECGIKSELLYGATPVAGDGFSLDDESQANTREGIISRFKKADCDFKVIIANPFAVAESISLHKVCHNAIYLERSFNCTHFLQSKDRIHRYGMPDGVNTNYYYLVSENSVDAVINMRLNEKQKRMNDIIEHSPIPLFFNVTDDADDDIKAILNDYAERKK